MRNEILYSGKSPAESSLLMFQKQKLSLWESLFRTRLDMAEQEQVSIITDHILQGQVRGSAV